MRGGVLLDIVQKINKEYGAMISKMETKVGSVTTSDVVVFVELQVKRIDDLFVSFSSHVSEMMAAERRRVDEQLELRARYNTELGLAESKRLDAIRAVDVNAVSIANERAAAQAIVLANQVSASAETLRTLVAATAQTVAEQLNQVSAGIAGRLTALEKSQYEGMGKNQVSDPMLVGMAAELKGLREAANTKSGAADGMGKMWGIGFGIISLIILVGVMLFSAFRH